MKQKPQNVYMPIDAFCGRVFGIAEGAERSQWVSRFALTLAGNGDEEFAKELLEKALADMAGGRERQARFRAKRKQKELEVLVNPTLPGTSSGNGEALNDEGATAPAGQSFEARQATPGARHHGASGQPSTPVPVSAHGDAAEGGLLTPWYGPGTGETFDQEATRADARIREDRDASATVRAQHPDGDAATREGAEAAISGFATSPSDIQKRPGKSATTPYCVEDSMLIHDDGSERGASGTAIDAVRRSPGAKRAEISPIGIMGNVRLTPEELGRYRAKYGDPTRLIDALSTYIAKTGKRYKSHFAALVSWARRDIESGIDPETGSKADQLSRIRFAARAAGIDAFSGKRIDFATGEVIEPASGNFPEIPYNPPELGEAE